MKFLKNITQKELFKITSLNSISVILKIVAGFITSKLLAIFVGPSGMALVGNFRNFTTSIENIATLGTNNGIVKYVAENQDDEHRLKKIISTIVIAISGTIILICLALLVFSNQLNNYLFGTEFKYQKIFIITAISLPFYIGSIVLLAIINGFSAYKKVVTINIIGSIIGVIFSAFLIFYFKTFGAFLSILVVPVLLFFVSIFYISKKIQISTSSFDGSILKNFSEYALMAFVSAIIAPMIYVVIRKHLIATSGIDSAGLWEALTRISSYYLLFLTTIISVYFLPKLSKATSNNETRLIFYDYFKTIIPVYFIGLILIYFLKKQLVSILFTNDFQPMTNLFFWQLLGDFFRGITLILGIQFFAKKMTKAFIFTELFSIMILYFSSIFLINSYGVIGVVMAYTVTYFLYFCVLGIYFRNIIRSK